MYMKACFITILTLATSVNAFAQSKPVLTQADYNAAKQCIGKFHGGHALIVSLRPFLRDEKQIEAIDGAIANGKKLFRDFTDLDIYAASFADDSNYNLSLGEGERMMQKGVKPFTDIRSQDKTTQLRYYLAHSAFTPECLNALNKTADIVETSKR